MLLRLNSTLFKHRAIRAFTRRKSVSLAFCERPPLFLSLSLPPKVLNTFDNHPGNIIRRACFLVPPCWKLLGRCKRTTCCIVLRRPPEATRLTLSAIPYRRGVWDQLLKSKNETPATELMSETVHRSWIARRGAKRSAVLLTSYLSQESSEGFEPYFSNTQGTAPCDSATCSTSYDLIR